MTMLRGALYDSELDVLSLSKMIRYPQGGGSVRPGYELGNIAKDFLATGDLRELARVIEEHSLSWRADREDRSLRISEETMENLDEVAAMVGATRITAVRALLRLRKEAIAADGNAGVPDGAASADLVREAAAGVASAIATVETAMAGYDENGAAAMACGFAVSNLEIAGECLKRVLQIIGAGGPDA